MSMKVIMMLSALWICQSLQLTDFRSARRLGYARSVSLPKPLAPNHAGDLFRARELTQLDMASITLKGVMNKPTVKEKVVALCEFLLSPLVNLYSIFSDYVTRLTGIGKKTVIKTNDSGASFKLPKAPSMKVISNQIKKAKEQAKVRAYMAEKIREIEEQERAHKSYQALVNKGGQWPPIITAPPPTRSGSTKRIVASLKDDDLRGKNVLVRCDLNVPVNEEGVITDDTRIRASIPTIKYLTEKGAKVMLLSHLGRPKGDGYEEKFSTKVALPRLCELLGTDVVWTPDCIGISVQKNLAHMKNGEVTLLQNSRFYKGDTKNDKDLSKLLARNADIFVNDAFGTVHRAHASTTGVTDFVRPAVAGFLLQKELDYLQGAVDMPKRPFAAIVGGSKVSTKISVLESLLDKVDKLVIGGAMVFTFLKARGVQVGNSLVEDDQLELARKLEQLCEKNGVQLLLAKDLVVADSFSETATTKIVPINEIPAGWMGLDIGPQSLNEVKEALSDCRTVIWNGPMGAFEMKPFSKGTFGVAEYMAGLTSKGCTTIIGGGDSVAAVEQCDLADRMSHISTGGGAALELLEGKVLPGVDALDSWP